LIREFLLETRCFRSGTHDFVVLHLEDEEELLCFLRERNEIVNTVQLSEGLLSSGKASVPSYEVNIDLTMNDKKIEISF